MLIEHYAGLFPAWLAPTQAVVMNITDKQGEWAEEVVRQLEQSGFRAKSDLRNEKIGFKIREHTLLKVPYLLVIGDREVESQAVAVRTREGADLARCRSPSSRSFSLRRFPGVVAKTRSNHY